MSRRTRVMLVAPWFPAEGGMAQLARTVERLLGGEGFPARRVESSGRSPVRIVRFFLTLLASVARCDVVHVFSSSGVSLWAKVLPTIALGKISGRRTVLHFMGGGAVHSARSWPVFKKLPFVWADVTAVPAENFRRGLENCGLRAHFRVVPNTVDVGPFLALPRRGDGVTLLAVKGLERNAGFDLLLRAMVLIQKRRPGVRLLIVGEGPERSALEALTKELSLLDCVQFLGAVPHDRIPEVFSKASLFVHTARSESFGLVLVEAMASGLPIVAFSVGGVSDVVREGVTGTLVPFGDVEAFADGVVRYLEDPALLIRASESGRRECLRFTVESVSPLWAKVYSEELVG